MDNSIFNDDGATVDLPDGLVQFRMNLVELFIDICQLLGSTAFAQKVLAVGDFMNVMRMAIIVVLQLLMLFCYVTSTFAFKRDEILPFLLVMQLSR